MTKDISSRRGFLAAAGGAGLLASGLVGQARAQESGQPQPEARASSEGAISVGDFGAKLDGKNDDTAAVQAAIDAAQERFVYPGNGAKRGSVPIVTFPPGDCLITRTIHWKSCSLIGIEPGISTRILWGGSDGAGPAILKPRGYPGGGWVNRLESLSFEPSQQDIQPSGWLRIGDPVDKFFLLRRLRFKGCRSDAIVLTQGWINLHWEHLRWDQIGGYAIRAIAHPRQHLHSFTIEHFTYDHSIPSSPCEGFVLFNNKYNQTNIGTISFSGARIEINEPWTGKQALITYKLPRGSSYQRTAGFLLKDIDYQDGHGMPEDCLLYLHTESRGRESLILLNCRVTGLSKVLGGSWVRGQYMPPVPRGGNFALTLINAGEFLEVNHGLALRGDDDGQSRSALSVAREGDAASRFRVDYDGRLLWGEGSTDDDTSLERVGKAMLRTDGRFVAAGGFGVGNSSVASGPGSVVRKIEIYDAEGNSLGFLPVYDRID